MESFIGVRKRARRLVRRRRLETNQLTSVSSRKMVSKGKKVPSGRFLGGRLATQILAE